MAFYANAPLPDTNARQVAQTIRPPSTSLLTIDSEDRFSSYTQASASVLNDSQAVNTTPYNFEIQKNESLMNGFFTRVGISEINFPWGIPNINQKTDTMAVFWAGTTSGSSNVTIFPGFYKPSQLAATLQAAIRAVTGIATFNLTYGNGVISDVNTPVFSYDTSDVGQLISFGPLAYNSADYPYPDTTKQLFHLLGFSDVNTVEVGRSGQGGYTFCQYTRYVDICCFQLTNNQALKDQTSQTVARDMLARIYLGDANIPGNVDASGGSFCPPGCAPFTIHREYASPKQIQWIPNQPIPGRLVFQVFDDAGALLSEVLPSGAPENAYAEQAGYLDWSMTLQVSEN